MTDHKAMYETLIKQDEPMSREDVELNVKAATAQAIAYLAQEVGRIVDVLEVLRKDEEDDDGTWRERPWTPSCSCLICGSSNGTHP
jgi:hypothetical protein